jgi:hypothetical protein
LVVSGINPNAKMSTQPSHGTNRKYDASSDSKRSTDDGNRHKKRKIETSQTYGKRLSLPRSIKNIFGKMVQVKPDFEKIRAQYGDFPINIHNISASDRTLMQCLLSIAFFYRGLPPTTEKGTFHTDNEEDPQEIKIVIPWVKTVIINSRITDDLYNLDRWRVINVDVAFEGQQSSDYYPNPAMCYMGIDILTLSAIEKMNPHYRGSKIMVNYMEMPNETH